tara:strand:- start:10 stop:1620 length:1611 start_codon:yes stop_codon:yes gene_type:complete
MKLLFENWREYLTEQAFRAGMKDPKPGTKEGPIAQIQQKLIQSGFMAPIPEDEFGIYGRKTRAAVRKFQKKAFPNQPDQHDGIVGADTLPKLKGWKAGKPRPSAARAAMKQKMAAAAIAKKKAAAEKGEAIGTGATAGMSKALIIGDSHVDWSSFGKYLAKALKSQGYSVARHGVGGSAAASWLSKRAKLLDKLNQQGPWDLLLISLGTNDIANSNVGCKGDKRCLKRAAAQKVRQIGAVAQKVEAEKTVWIAPPTLHGAKHYSKDAGDAMYTAGTPAGVDVVVDSRPSTKGRRKDKVHPLGAQARAWASAVLAGLSGRGPTASAPEPTQVADKASGANRVLIIGNSQAQGMGAKLESVLRGMGKKVTRIAKPGASARSLLRVLRARKINPKNYDVAYVFAGGDRTYSPGTPDAAVRFNSSEITNLLKFLNSAGKTIWSSPPPATKIRSLRAVSAGFGRVGRKAKKQNNKDFWFDTGTARRREEKHKKIEELVNAFEGAEYFDVRSVAEPFPPQADGIHVHGSAKAKVANSLAAMA